jgi:hypothetical protein
MSTTLLGAIFVSSPFHTPLSRGLYWLPLWLLSLVGHFLLWLPVEDVSRFCIKLYQYISSHIRSSIGSDATVDDESTSVRSLDSFPAPLPLVEAISNRIKAHLLNDGASRNREDETAKQDPVLEQEALAWLAQQLPISDDAHERLLLCVSGIPALSTTNPPSPRFHNAPWLTILEVLSECFMRQIFETTSSEMNYRGVGILLLCINSPFIRNRVVPAEKSSLNPRDRHYWGPWHFEDEKNPRLGEIGDTNMTFLLGRDIPVPSLGSKYELETTWKLIRWCNSTKAEVWHVYELCGASTWPDVFGDIRRYSPEFLESCLISKSSSP